VGLGRPTRDLRAGPLAERVNEETGGQRGWAGNTSTTASL